MTEVVLNPMAPPTAAYPPRVKKTPLLRRKESRLRITDCIATYPWVLMGIIFFLFIMFTFIGFGVIGFKVANTDFRVWDNINTEIVDAMENVEEKIERRRDDGAVDDLLREKTIDYYSLVYKTGETDKVFTLGNVKWMKATEDHLRLHEDYRFYCRANWFASNADCPGASCPWYIESWDYTFESPLQDGSKIVCASPLQNSPVYFLYNTYWAVTDSVSGELVCDERAMTADAAFFERCLAEAEPAYRPQAELELGGVEPTQYMLDFFVALCERVIVSDADPRAVRHTYLSGFFGKNRGSNFGTQVTKAMVQYGGPMERSLPESHAFCHINTPTQAACEAIEGCAWVNYAGIYRNTTACAPPQFPRVSSVMSATINEDQVSLLAEFYTEGFLTYFQADAQDGPIDVLFQGKGVMQPQFDDVLIRDALLSMASFFFVYLYVQIHTGSFFLASFGMLQVIMPFPLAYFVYYSIIGVKGFFGFSTLTAYIMLAIGADDLFVFFDNWEQSEEYYSMHPVDLKTRLCRAWCIAGRATAVTSITTMAAFVASMTSPLLEISTFGLFATLLVFFDYTLCMTFFAATVVAYHRTFENTLGCCCCGQTMCGSWFNCCTCFTMLVGVYDDEKPTCMHAKLNKARCAQTEEELTEKREDVQKRAAHPVNEEHAAIDYTELRKDLEYRKRTWAAAGMGVVGLVVYLLGFILLQTDHTSPRESSVYLLWIFILVIGLLLLCSCANALRAASDHIKDIAKKYNAEPPSTMQAFLRTRVAPYLSGMVDPDAMEAHHTAADTSGRSASTGSACLDGLRQKPWLWTAARLAPAACLFIFWIVMVIGAFQLKPATGIDQWLPSWHPFQRYMDSQTNDFVTDENDAIYSVSVIFGLDPDDPVDRVDFDKYDPDEKGVAVFSDFAGKQEAFASTEFQEFGIVLCERVLNMSRKGAYLQRTLLADGEDDQNCFMKGLRAFRQSRNESFPVPPSEFLTVAEAFIHDNIARQASFGPGSEFVRESDKYSDKILFAYEDGFDHSPTGIHLVYFTFNTTLRTFNNAYSITKDWYDAWEDFIDSINEDNPAWVNNIYGSTANPWAGQALHSSDVWVLMHVQRVLVDGAFQGAFISLGLAALIVCIATTNFLICLLVLLELIGVVGCVIGMVFYIGWEMSMIESVSITMLVGISVDYVVHYAIHYAHVRTPSTETIARVYGATERQYKTYATVIEMGPTVLGGAATSIGASLILFCTWIQFFFKFGAIFLLTIVFSFIWAVFFFLPALSFFGPQGNTASFRPLLAKIAPSCFGDEEEEEEGDEHEAPQKVEAGTPQYSKGQVPSENFPGNQ
ncbi:Protein dispatched [Diplonema papillatum]|nr:Protein dispatched [Diplonema papillatum]